MKKAKQQKKPSGRNGFINFKLKGLRVTGYRSAAININ